MVFASVDWANCLCPLRCLPPTDGIVSGVPLSTLVRGKANARKGDLANLSSISFLKSTSSASIFGLMYRYFFKGPQASAIMFPLLANCSCSLCNMRLACCMAPASKLYDLVTRWCLVRLPFTCTRCSTASRKRGLLLTYSSCCCCSAASRSADRWFDTATFLFGETVSRKRISDSMRECTCCWFRLEGDGDLFVPGAGSCFFKLTRRWSLD